MGIPSKRAVTDEAGHGRAEQAFAGSAAGSDGCVEIRKVSKSFKRVTVVREADLTVRRGEIHGLVGQNGSGKSTLVKLLAGVYRADEGSSIAVAGHPLSMPPTPVELRRHGLAFVHQDLGIVAELSVSENICVGRYDTRPVLRSVRMARERAAVISILESLQSSIDPDARAGELHAGDRAVVAVARALYKLQPGTGCIVFDESTQSLPRELLPDFYDLVRRLAASGTAVLIVSHHLQEILTLADRVSVIRDGQIVAGGLSTGAVSESELASLMLGRELQQQGAIGDRRPRRAQEGAALLVRDLAGRSLRGLSFEVRPGEVLGLTGPSDSGHEEVPYAIAAGAPSTQGRVELGHWGYSLPFTDMRALLRAGIALVPQQRAQDGLSLEESAVENITLPRVAAHGRWLLRSGWQQAEFRTATQMLGVVPDRSEMGISKFSGGNQQKLMLAKWLLSKPRVLLLHEPTQAVDVGARVDILNAIRAAADDGVIVLLSTIETQDLARVCDRVLTLRNGTIQSELAGPLSAEEIEALVYPELTAAV